MMYQNVELELSKILEALTSTNREEAFEKTKINLEENVNMVTLRNYEQLLDPPTFKQEYEQMNIDNELIFYQVDEIEKVEIDVHDLVQYPSFVYDVDFIGIDGKLSQEKTLANFGHDTLNMCFMNVGLEEQCVEINKAQVHA